MHALACVCATGLLVCGAVDAAAGLLGLVGAQMLLLVALAPTPSPANVVTIFRSFIPPAVVWWKAGSDFGQVRTLFLPTRRPISHTVRNACSTEYRVLLRRAVPCGAFFFSEIGRCCAVPCGFICFENPAVRCGAVF